MADRGRAGRVARISATKSSSRAGPREQFTPATSTPASASAVATSAGRAPSAVMPSCPKVTSATTGRSLTRRTTSTATSSSRRSEKVSRITRSAPASQSTPICSAKALAAVSRNNWDLRRARRPSGPTEPAIHTAWPLISRASRASLTPRKLISRCWRASRTPSSARRRGLAANVLVWTTSAPARMYARWISRTQSPCSRLSRSRH